MNCPANSKRFEALKGFRVYAKTLREKGLISAGRTRLVRDGVELKVWPTKKFIQLIDKIPGSFLLMPEIVEHSCLTFFLKIP